MRGGEKRGSAPGWLTDIPNWRGHWRKLRLGEGYRLTPIYRDGGVEFKAVDRNGSRAAPTMLRTRRR